MKTPFCLRTSSTTNSSKNSAQTNKENRRTQNNSGKVTLLFVLLFEEVGE